MTACAIGWLLAAVLLGLWLHTRVQCNAYREVIADALVERL
jgi:hypothetical protein